MTAINISTDIPTNINTLERLAMWAIMALKRVNPTESIIVQANAEPQDVAQTAIFQASDNTIRFNGVVFIEVDAAYAEDNTSKIWMKAKDLSNTNLPEAYKQN